MITEHSGTWSVDGVIGPAHVLLCGLDRIALGLIISTHYGVYHEKHFHPHKKRDIFLKVELNFFWLISQSN